MPGGANCIGKATSSWLEPAWAGDVVGWRRSLRENVRAHTWSFFSTPCAVDNSTMLEQSVLVHESAVGPIDCNASPWLPMSLIQDHSAHRLTLKGHRLDGVLLRRRLPCFDPLPHTEGAKVLIRLLVLEVAAWRRVLGLTRTRHVSIPSQHDTQRVHICGYQGTRTRNSVRSISFWFLSPR